MAADPEVAAMEFMAKGDKKLKSFSLFGNKKEEALEMYQKGAICFKQAKKWQEAGDAYHKCAEMMLEMKQTHDASSNFLEAALCFKKCNIAATVKCYEAACRIQIENGRFQQAAKMYKEVAEIAEADGVVDEALKNFKLAAEYYAQEEQTSTANTMFLKVAAISATLERYGEAIEIYERVSAASLDVALLKWSVKDYLFHSLLCHMANPASDIIAAKRAHEKYLDMDPTFQDTRECQLVAKLLQAVEDADADAFTSHVAEFDSMSRLDKWRTTLLLTIKKKIGEQDFS